MKKSVKRFFRWLIILVVVLIGLTVAAAAIFQNQIGSRIIRELNESLETELTVKQVRLSFFSNFPTASVHLNEVILEDNQGGVLLESKKISFRIGLFPLILGNYQIDAVQIKNGALLFRIDAEGQANYEILPSPADSSQTGSESDLRVQLQEATLEDMELIYTNELTGQHVNLLLNDARFSGQIDDSFLQLQSDARLLSRFVDVQDIRYLPGKEIEYDADLQINLKNGAYTFNRVEGRLGENLFKVDGSIEKMEGGPFYDIYILSEQGSIQGALQLLPAEYLSCLSDFSSQGQFKFDALIRGQLSRDLNPEVRATLSLQEGSITSPRLKNDLKQVTFTAEYNNGKFRDQASSILRINDFKGYFDQELIEMDLRIDDFENPQVDFQMDGAVPLAEVYGLFNNPRITAGNGEIEIRDLQVKGAYADMIRTNRIGEVEASGSLKFDDASLTLNEEKLILDRGTLTLEGNQMTLQDLKLEGADSEIEMKGTAFNLLPVIFADSVNSKNAELEFQVELAAAKLDLDRLLVAGDLQLAKTDTANRTPQQLDSLNRIRDSLQALQIAKRERITRLLNGSFSTRIDSFNYHDIRGANFTGLVGFDNQVMDIRGSAITMGGIVRGEGAMEFQTEPRLRANLVLEAIDIDELFRQFNNFQQAFVREENLKGKLSSRVLIQSFWDRKGNLLRDKLNVLAEVEIKDGMLNDFKLLEGFSSFVKVQDLKNIKFVDLRNYLEIRRQTLYIPAMFIQSNAMNLTVSGEHRFDREFEYNVKINAGQVMTNKFKKYDPTLQPKKARRNGFFNLYYQIQGNNEDYTYKTAKRQVKNDFERSKYRKTDIQRALEAAFENTSWFKEPAAWLDAEEETQEPDQEPEQQ